MKRTILMLILIAAGAVAATAQNRQPCSSPAGSGFDFWIGTWNLEWLDAQGQKRTGRNVVRKILGGCVIEENFDGGGTPPYLGKSHTMFDPVSGKWKQTWVDSGGAYLDFTGEFADGKMTLRREFFLPDGKPVKQRMVFSNITADSLDWNWERSDDGGRTWKTNWRLSYRRAPEVPAFDLGTVRSAIAAELADYGKRFATGDPEFYSQRYTADACIMPFNEPETCGRDRIRDRYFRDGKNNYFRLTMTLSEVSGGDAEVVAAGTYLVADLTGKTLDKGKFLQTWRSEDGRWKMRREIWNSNGRTGQ